MISIVLIDFDRIRRRDNGRFLAYGVDASSYFQFLPGYTPTHCSEEMLPEHGRFNTVLRPRQEPLSVAPTNHSVEDKQQEAAREREAIANHGNRLQNAVYTQGAAPISLRAATPTPSTSWLDDPDVTRGLPRGKVMVALRDISHDVEIEIAVEDGMNKAVYWVKPKSQAPIQTLITTQHLDPLRCSHAAERSFSAKLFLVCSGQYAGRLGRAIAWGVADDIILKPVRHEMQMTNNKYKVRRFTEKPVDGALLHVSKYICALVPMMPDEEKEAKAAIAIRDLQYIVEKQLLGLPITLAEKTLLVGY